MSAPRHIWVGRILDALLLFSTLSAVLLGLWTEVPSQWKAFMHLGEHVPEWGSLLALICFFVFFVLRWLVSVDRHEYLKKNWLDLALVVLLASPFLRLLTAFKVVGVMPALRVGTMLRSNRKRILKLIIVSQDSFPVAMALVFGVVFMFGTAAFLFEHHSNPQYGDISDGLWWAFVTLTTVGYGDIVPITAAGRIVGVFTMVFGITIYSLMIANLTFFVEEQGRIRQKEKEKEKARKKKAKKEKVQVG